MRPRAAREKLKTDLAKCTPEQQDRFKRIYGDASMDAAAVVDAMPMKRVRQGQELVDATLREEVRRVMES